MDTRMKCQHVFSKGARRGQPCGRRCTRPSAEGAARPLCREHEPFALDALPLLAMRAVAGGVASAEVLLALSRVSRAFHAATSDPALWDRFAARHRAEPAEAAVEADFRLTPRQKLSLAIARKKELQPCESCSAEVARLPLDVPCCLCQPCVRFKFASREALRSFAVDPAVLVGLRGSEKALYVRADVERALGRTLGEHAAAVRAAKRARVMSAALSAFAQGPLPEALSAMDPDVERAVAASDAVRTLSAASDADACVAGAVDQVARSRNAAAVALLFAGHSASFLLGSPTLSLALKPAGRSCVGCLDGIAGLSVPAVLAEAARCRNAKALKARVAAVVAATGLPAEALASLEPSDEVDAAAAAARHDEGILRTLGAQLMDAPGRFAGYEDARHRLWLMVETVYAEGTDALVRLIADGDLHGVVAWFTERNARAHAEIRRTVEVDLARVCPHCACPLCPWADRSQDIRRKKAEQRVWAHMSGAHGVLRR